MQQNILYRAITDFTLHRSLFDRWLGIASIRVQTAGQSQTVTGYEGSAFKAEDATQTQGDNSIMSRFERYTTAAIGWALLLLVNTGCEHNSLSPEQQALEEIAALPQSSYHAIDFIDSKQGWVVGNGGTIFHSIDGGKHWSQQNSNTPDDLYRVQFVDRDFGWIAGTRSLLHTENGGNSWQEQRADSSFGRFVTMQFVDRSDGWLTGPIGGGLYHLTESGTRWEIITLADFSSVSSLSFIDARVGYVLFASGRLFKTSDGGVSWAQAAQPRFVGAKNRHVV